MIIELEFKKDAISMFSSVDSKLVTGTLERVQLRGSGCVTVTVSGKTMYVCDSVRNMSILESVTYSTGSTSVANMADGESMYRFFKNLLFNGAPE